MPEIPTYAKLEKNPLGLEKTELNHISTVELLRDEISRYRILVGQSRDGIVLLDQNGKVYEANKRFADMLGYSMEEIHSLYVWDWDAQFTKEQLIGMIQAIDDTGAHFETRQRRKDGTLIDVELSNNGAVYRGQKLVFCVCRDITDRKRAEEDYRTLFREMLDGFALHEIICDEKGIPIDYRFIAVNPAFERMTGLKMEDIAGKTVLEIMPNTERHWIEIYGKVALTGEPALFENYAVEMKKHFKVTAYQPVQNQFACIFVDITDQKRAEMALRESKERLDLAMDAANAGSWEWDLDSGKNTWSEKLWRMYGLTPHCCEASYEIWRQSIVSEDRVRVEKIVQEATRKSSEINIEWRVRDLDGKERWLMSRGRPIKDAADRERRYMGIVMDISERKRAEEERVKLEDRLQQAQKLESIGTLAGGIAHDFNNILYPLLGFAELLKEDLPKESPLQEHIDEILRATMRSKDLVKQILTFSRKDNQNAKPIRLQPIAKEALKLLRSSIPATIDIQQEIDADCGIVMADPTQVHQIVMNLATNAYHAMEDAGGKLQVSLKQIELASEPDPSVFQALTAGKYALLTVTDNGIGIEKAISGKIFDPYFTTKGVGKGTGLGLSVVHGIVKAYKGDIRIHSAPGKGTTVRVYLPIMALTTENKGIENSEPLAGGTEKILLVDDENPIVRVEQRMLENLSYHVTARTSSLEALATFQADPAAFNLVLTDMTMPTMTGMQLAEKLISIRPDIPIILCTGYSEKISAGKAEALGVKGFLMKPVDKSEMARMVRKVLDEAKG
jgi:PAS domain S-box-containing protein